MTRRRTFPYNDGIMTAAPAAVPAFEPPRTIFLELTSRCNMHCAFCPSDVLRRPKEHLAGGRLRSFLDQVRALGLRTPVLLNVLGERFSTSAFTRFWTSWRRRDIPSP
jgi:MoaA/NifB/PqqE/SkfB family radical SAM enzyme